MVRFGCGGEGWLQLLSAQEIFPGISVSDFAQRRKALKSYLPTESMVILGSATVKQMTEVVPYPFRQDADYLYFTGCQQPEGLAVLDDQTELCMFMPEHDTEVLQTMWGWWVKISCFMFVKLELVYQSTDFRESMLSISLVKWALRHRTYNQTAEEVMWWFPVELVSDSFGI